MYLVMVLYDNRVNHIMSFDPMVWSHPDSAWELACDYADQMARKLGFDLPRDHWVKDSKDNEFRWCGVSVAIERAYTPIRNEGVMAVAKAHADADRLLHERKTTTRGK